MEDSTCFIDTNIWLYAFIKIPNSDKTEISNTLINGTKLIVSTQVINEIIVNLIKKQISMKYKLVN